MGKQYLSVKELAGIAGISTQSVYKQLTTKLQPYATKVANRTMIDISALREVYGIDGCKPDATKVANNVQPDATKNPDDKSLNQVIEILREQLSTKDKQITDLQNQLDATSKMLERVMESNDHLQIMIGQAQQIALLDKPSAEPKEEENQRTAEPENLSSKAEDTKKKFSIFNIFKR